MTCPPFSARGCIGFLSAVLAGFCPEVPAQEFPGIDLSQWIRSLRVPIHGQPADPAGGEYGLWAAAADYKASFHDGFAFYPHLGEDAPAHLPLRWTTESVIVAGEELLAGPPETRHTEFRFERRVGDVVEAYDVLAEGVEQTFTLLRRPRIVGELVITGRVATPLAAEPVPARVGDLEFGAAGEPVIRYGKAMAVDAAGTRTPVATAYDGHRIRLIVPATVLRDAVFPLVVDPLIAAVGLRPLTATGDRRPTITADTSGVAPRLVIAWRVTAAAPDIDVYALVTSFDFQSGTWLYQDVNASWSTSLVEAGFVAGARRWVLGLQREFSTGKLARVYLHDVANTTANSGQTLFLNAPAGYDHVMPAVGGAMAGNLMLLVYERVHQTSGLTYAYGRRIDCSTGTPGAEFAFSSGGFLVSPLQRPSVTPLSRNGSSWVAAMAGSDGIRVGMVMANGSGTITTRLLVSPAAGERFLDQGVPPDLCVAGSEDRFLLACASWSIGGSQQTTRIRAVRFDWTGSEPSIVAVRDVHSVTGNVSGVPAIQLGSCEHDPLTRSHWVLTHGNSSGTTYIVRLGGSGGITESQQFPPATFRPDVAFGRPGFSGTFPIVYVHRDNSSTATLLGGRFVYPADATSVAYGTPCTPGANVTSSRPYAGHAFFNVTASGLVPGTLGIYVLGLAPGNVPLNSYGLPGCFLHVATPALATWVVAADAQGEARVVYSLPDAPLFVGDLFTQWLLFDASSPQPLRAYGGIRVQVR